MQLKVCQKVLHDWSRNYVSEVLKETESLKSHSNDEASANGRASRISRVDSRVDLHSQVSVHSKTPQRFACGAAVAAEAAGPVASVSDLSEE